MRFEAALFASDALFRGKTASDAVQYRLFCKAKKPILQNQKASVAGLKGRFQPAKWPKARQKRCPFSRSFCYLVDSQVFNKNLSESLFCEQVEALSEILHSRGTSKNQNVTFNGIFLTFCKNAFPLIKPQAPHRDGSFRVCRFRWGGC